MNKILTVLSYLVAGIAIVWVAAVSATQSPKVFVCKYVGTPGVNETLKDGKNPISVSENSIKDFAGVGSSFNDAQGRSFVVALDTGQEGEDIPTCPAPTPNETPPPPVTPPTTPSPPVTPPVVQGFSGK